MKSHVTGPAVSMFVEEAGVGTVGACVVVGVVVGVVGAAVAPLPLPVPVPDGKKAKHYHR